MAECVRTTAAAEDSSNTSDSSRGSSIDLNLDLLEELAMDNSAVATAAKLEGNVNAQQSTKEEILEAENSMADNAVGDPSGTTSGIDRLLQQHRREIMFELRRLQLGDKPVTGQENRKNVEEFFRRSTDTTPAPEESRPEEVVVEVRALVERRPVSSISANFRRELENRLRGSLGAPAAPRPAPRRSRAPDHQQVAAAAAAAARARSTLTTSEVPHQRTTPVAPPVPNLNTDRPEVTPRTRVDVRRALDRAATLIPAPPTQLRRAQESEDESDSDWEDAEETLSPTTPAAPQLPLAAAEPEVGPEERARAWLRQQPVHAGSNVSLWDSLEQTYRDNIISEISDLVQQQLVTQTLHGNFRGTLERHMGDRLQSTGTNGRRVQEVINQLPRFPRDMRNDFSNLGIPSAPVGGRHDDLSDSVSVISATAAVTIPHTQSTAVMSREIGSLKAQMEELKNMMKLSFDLQLDIQRAIRQEVAAAVNAAIATPQAVQTLATGAPSTSGYGATSFRPAHSTKCVICLDKGADAVLYKCGHLCLCYTCGLNLRQRGSNCPVCRAPIQDIIRAYTVGNTE